MKSFIKDEDIDGVVVRREALPISSEPSEMRAVPDCPSRIDPTATPERAKAAFDAYHAKNKERIKALYYPKEGFENKE